MKFWNRLKTLKSSIFFGLKMLFFSVLASFKISFSSLHNPNYTISRGLKLDFFGYKLDFYKRGYKLDTIAKNVKVIVSQKIKLITMIMRSGLL